jgi:hypothetical protein
MKLNLFLQLDNTAEYYMKNPGILTHQDLLEEYGASGEAANNMLEDKGKIFQCCSLLNVTWLTYEPFHFSHNSVSPQWTSFTHVLSTSYNFLAPQSLCKSIQLFLKTHVSCCQVTGLYEHSDKPAIAIKFKGNFISSKMTISISEITLLYAVV